MRSPEISPLELDKRHRIYDTLSRAPGLHFRELQRRTGLAMGELQYHLDFLEKNTLVKKQKSGKFVHYFALKVVRRPEEEKMLPLLRQRRIRQMLLVLLEKKARQADLSVALSLSPGAISVYLNRLVDEKIITRDAGGFLRVTDPKTVMDMFISYRQSFLDPLLDRFIETWLPLGKNE